MQLKQQFGGVDRPNMSQEPNHLWGEGRRVQADDVWSEQTWDTLHASVAEKVRLHSDEANARAVVARWGRKVLRSYSSSFYAVTRFLPSQKRADVEMVYAAVRYPDEVVDAFHLNAESKVRNLDAWQDQFSRTSFFPGIVDAVKDGIPVTLAGFRDVARRNDIPDEHYMAFLEAMKSDISPQLFSNWSDLVDRYIYGSATVVGYFLAHIYKPAEGATMAECLDSARVLAIALQLTNFARDVADDSARGRCYLPTDRTDANGNRVSNGVLAGEEQAIVEATWQLADEAAKWYDRAEPGIQSFHRDSRIAIEACHRLYSRLNSKILASENAGERSSLSMFEKLSVLPTSKYWRLPAALVFER